MSLIASFPSHCSRRPCLETRKILSHPQTGVSCVQRQTKRLPRFSSTSRTVLISPSMLPFGGLRARKICFRPLSSQFVKPKVHLPSDIPILEVAVTMSDEHQVAKDQLAYVNLSLEADPTNSDLLKLKTELLELIELTQAAQGGAAASSGSGVNGKGGAGDTGKGKGKAKDVNSNWQDAGPYRAGMDCMAKYKDGKL